MSASIGFDGHDHWIKAIAVSPDGGFVVSSGLDNKAKIWHPKGTVGSRGRGRGRRSVLAKF